MRRSDCPSGKQAGIARGGYAPCIVWKRVLSLHVSEYGSQALAERLGEALGPGGLILLAGGLIWLSFGWAFYGPDG